MIGKLTGIVDSVASDAAIIDVGGVGYVVHASGKTLAEFAEMYGLDRAAHADLLALDGKRQASTAQPEPQAQ